MREDCYKSFVPRQNFNTNLAATDECDGGLEASKHKIQVNIAPNLGIYICKYRSRRGIRIEFLRNPRELQTKTLLNINPESCRHYKEQQWMMEYLNVTLQHVEFPKRI